MHSVWTLYLPVFINVVILTLMVFVNSVKVCSIPVSCFFLPFLTEAWGGEEKKKEMEKKIILI